MNIAMANASSAQVLIKQLIAQGITHFCAAPGNRSAPLFYALSQEKEAKVIIHFDERGGAFWALGVAKVTGKPAVIITTSGSAVANLMPAIFEAHHSRIPLLVITADRPIELYNTMANQTTNQLGCFGLFATFFPMPTPSLDGKSNLQAIRRIAGQAVLATTFPTPGVVHLNCPYTEPLLPDEACHEETIDPLPILSPSFTVSEKELLPYLDHFLCTEGALIIGRLSQQEAAALVPLAHKLKWPIFADPLSCYRNQNDPLLIRHANLVLKELTDFRSRTLVHVGDSLISKQVTNWMASHVNTPLLHIASHANRCDPSHLVTHRIISDLPSLFSKISSLLPEKKEGKSLRLLQNVSQQLQERIHSYFAKKNETLSEPSLFYHLPRYLHKNEAVFFGNSMPIRHADLFVYQLNGKQTFFGNRGLSGIDGNLATCAGIAQHMPLTAIVGDQTFLHDLNSLKLIQEAPHPVKLIVINNGGGAIFSFVTPPSIQKKHPQFVEQFLTASHHYECAAAATLFSMPYAKVEREEDLLCALSEEKTILIEIPTKKETTLAIYQEMRELATETLSCNTY